LTTFFSNEDEDDEEEGKDETDTAKQLKASIFLNIAACDIKLGEWREAIEFCDKALDIEPQNQKALYRKGKALALLQEWDESKKIFQSLLQLDPENNDVKRELVFQS
jgi:FK506-binding protein 4/5